jgi:hypothetical protein
MDLEISFMRRRGTLNTEYEVAEIIEQIERAAFHPSAGVLVKVLL